MMTTRRTTLATMLLCPLLAALGCASTAGPNGALGSDMAQPDTSRLYRMYAYYPNAEVYHSSFQRMYYWQEEDGWASGSALPEDVRISEVDREMIRLPTSTPSVYHEQVAARFPSLDSLLARKDDDRRDWETDFEQIVTVPTER